MRIKGKKVSTLKNHTLKINTEKCHALVGNKTLTELTDFNNKQYNMGK